MYLCLTKTTIITIAAITIGIAVDDLGNNYLTGSFTDTANFGDYTLTSSTVTGGLNLSLGLLAVNVFVETGFVGTKYVWSESNVEFVIVDDTTIEVTKNKTIKLK